MQRLLCAIALSLACIGSAEADDMTVKGITISNPWARATPGKAPNGAGYVALKNAGDADRIVGASSNVSSRTELHAHLAENGIMRMRKMETVELPPGGEVVFKPHGKHIMFIGLNGPLKEGQTVHLTLTLEKTGDVMIEMPVMPLGFKGFMSHGKTDMKHGDHSRQGDGMKMEKKMDIKAE